MVSGAWVLSGIVFFFIIEKVCTDVQVFTTPIISAQVAHASAGAENDDVEDNAGKPSEQSDSKTRERMEASGFEPLIN